MVNACQARAIKSAVAFITFIALQVSVLLPYTSFHAGLKERFERQQGLLSRLWSLRSTPQTPHTATMFRRRNKTSTPSSPRTPRTPTTPIMDFEPPAVANLPFIASSPLGSPRTSTTESVTPPPAPIFTTQWESKVGALPKKERVGARDMTDQVGDALDKLDISSILALKGTDKIRDTETPELVPTNKATTSRKTTPQSLKPRPNTMAPSAADPSEWAPLPERLAVSLPLIPMSVLRSRPVPASPIGNAWSGEHYWKPQFSPSPLRTEVEAPTLKEPSPPVSPRHKSVYDEVLGEVNKLASKLLDDDRGLSEKEADLEAAAMIVEAMAYEVEEIYGYPVPGDLTKKNSDALKEKKRTTRNARIFYVEDPEEWLEVNDSAEIPEFRNTLDKARGSITKTYENSKKNGDVDLSASVMCLVWATKILEDIIYRNEQPSPARKALDELSSDSDSELMYGQCLKSIGEELADAAKRKSKSPEKRSSMKSTHVRENSLDWKKKKAPVRFSNIEEPEEESPAPLKKERVSAAARRDMEGLGGLAEIAMLPLPWQATGAVPFSAVYITKGKARELAPARDPHEASPLQNKNGLPVVQKTERVPSATEIEESPIIERKCDTNAVQTNVPLAKTNRDVSSTVRRQYEMPSFQMDKAKQRQGGDLPFRRLSSIRRKYEAVQGKEEAPPIPPSKYNVPPLHIKKVGYAAQKESARVAPKEIERDVQRNILGHCATRDDEPPLDGEIVEDESPSLGRRARMRASGVDRKEKGRAPSVLDLEGWAEKLKKLENDTIGLAITKD